MGAADRVAGAAAFVEQLVVDGEAEIAHALGHGVGAVVAVLDKVAERGL